VSTGTAGTAHADAGSIAALLERLNTSVPFESIDELWLFPTRRIAGVESTVVVLALYTDKPDRRRVATAHFKATRNKRGEAKVETDLRDHAIAPADRLTRVIDGVLRRLGDDLSTTPPRSARISAAEDRWLALIEAAASNIELDDALERVRVRLRALGREDVISAAPVTDTDDSDLEQSVSDAADHAATTESEVEHQIIEAVDSDSINDSDAASAEPSDTTSSHTDQTSDLPSEDNTIRAQERTGVEEENA